MLFLASQGLDLVHGGAAPFVLPFLFAKGLLKLSLPTSIFGLILAWLVWYVVFLLIDIGVSLVRSYLRTGRFSMTDHRVTYREALVMFAVGFLAYVFYMRGALRYRPFALITAVEAVLLMALIFLSGMFSRRTNLSPISLDRLGILLLSSAAVFLIWPIASSAVRVIYVLLYVDQPSSDVTSAGYQHVWWTFVEEFRWTFVPNVLLCFFSLPVAFLVQANPSLSLWVTSALIVAPAVLLASRGREFLILSFVVTFVDWGCFWLLATRLRGPPTPAART